MRWASVARIDPSGKFLTVHVCYAALAKGPQSAREAESVPSDGTHLPGPAARTDAHHDSLRATVIPTRPRGAAWWRTFPLGESPHPVLSGPLRTIESAYDSVGDGSASDVTSGWHCGSSSKCLRPNRRSRPSSDSSRHHSAYSTVVQEVVSIAANRMSTRTAPWMPTGWVHLGHRHRGRLERRDPSCSYVQDLIGCAGWREG